MYELLHDDQHYATDDLGLAAMLSLVYPLVAVDRHDPDNCQFIFERGELIDHYVSRYHQRLLTVEPHAFVEQLTVLNNRSKAETDLC